jgi:hypothetical protein
MSTYFDRFQEAYSQTTLEFGVADIFADGSGNVIERAAAFVLLMMLARRKGASDRVRGVVVVAPPKDVGANCEQTSMEKVVVTSAEELFERALSKVEVAAVAKFVTVVHPADLRVESVLDCLRNVDHGWVVTIIRASLYRTNNVARSPSSVPISLPEDLWISHLCELARQSVPIVKEKQFYLLLDTGEPVPQKEENVNRIRSIEECGVFGFHAIHDAEGLIAKHAPEWKGFAKAGRLGPAFASVDALPSWMDSQKSFLKLQVMNGIAPPEEILRVLRDDYPNIRAKADARGKLKLAQIALGAADEDIARSLLKDSVGEIESAEDLLLAFDVADQLDEYVPAEQLLDRADLLFPDAPVFLDARLRFYLHQRRFTDISERLLSNPFVPLDPQRKFFFQTVSSALGGGAMPDFALLLKTVDEVTPDFGSWCQALCANESMVRGDPYQALKICLSGAGTVLTPGVARVLIAALKRVLLDRQGETFTVSGDLLLAPVHAVIQYLAENPDDAANRLRLTTLLSAEVSGMMGISILIVLASHLSETISVLPEHEGSLAAPDDPDACFESLKNIMIWAELQSPLLPSLTTIPSELFQAPADGLLWLVKNTLKQFSDLRDSREEKGFDNVMMVGLLVAPHTTDPDGDLDMLRYSGARYIAASKAQKARDLAEQALQTSGRNDARKRLGWLAFADVYHRCQNLNGALLGMACVLSLPNSIHPEQVYQELSLLVRIYRDLRFLANAKQLADRLLTLCSELGLDDLYAERVQTLLLQIRMIEVLGHPETLKTELPVLCQQAADHCTRLREEGEELSPAVAILAQAVQQSIAAGIPVDSEILQLLRDRLAALPGTTANLIQLLDPAVSNGQNLFAYAGLVQKARYSEDVAFDLMPLGVATRRFLDSDAVLLDTAATAFAIEALTNHAINGSLKGGYSPFEQIDRSIEMAGEIVKRGVDVLMLGLSEKGSLVVLHLRQDAARSYRESIAVFSGEKYLTWTKRFPYAYGAANEPMNLFYQTLEGIGTSAALSGPTLLVMDNSLHQMPPNLIMAGENFAGRTVPMASAPSLSWVWQTASQERSASKRTAWISTEFAEDRNPALITIAERLEQTFAERGFNFETSDEIPDSLAECEIAVVAAHGSILPEGRFIQRISNDSDLSLYPSALANALRDSTIVVLFICSGGRLDSHPISETAIGLVSQLMDQGCGTVIASPWPLDTRVPSHWLPAFLEEWEAGKSVIEATFSANEYVSRQMGDSPTIALAMNVFGDPLRKKRKFDST